MRMWTNLPLLLATTAVAIVSGAAVIVAVWYDEPRCRCSNRTICKDPHDSGACVAQLRSKLVQTTRAAWSYVSLISYAGAYVELLSWELSCLMFNRSLD